MALQVQTGALELTDLTPQQFQDLPGLQAILDCTNAHCAALLPPSPTTAMAVALTAAVTAAPATDAPVAPAPCADANAALCAMITDQAICETGLGSYASAMIKAACAKTCGVCTAAPPTDAVALDVNGDFRNDITGDGCTFAFCLLLLGACVRTGWSSGGIA